MKLTETRWGIVYADGLYVGQWLTRAAAIAEHSAKARRMDEPETSQFVWGGLSDDQREAWERCRKRGDRAVKLTITYDCPA